MPTVKISQKIYDDFAAHTEKQYLTRDVSRYVEMLMHSELQRGCAPGYERDPMTGCKTRHQLVKDIASALMGSGWEDRSLFSQAYLCVDIAHFKTYVDRSGLAAGDDVLRDLAGQLQDSYPNQDVYRFGGNEFVIALADPDAGPPELQLPVDLRSSILSVRIRRDNRRRGSLDSAVLYHIQMAIESTTPGCELLTYDWGMQ